MKYIERTLPELAKKINYDIKVTKFSQNKYFSDGFKDGPIGLFYEIKHNVDGNTGKYIQLSI